VATVHPAMIVRIRDSGERDRERRAFAADLKLIAPLVRS
jgi:hypothetical protein